MRKKVNPEGVTTKKRSPDCLEDEKRSVVRLMNKKQAIRYFGAKIEPPEENPGSGTALYFA